MSDLTSSGLYGSRGWTVRSLVWDRLSDYFVSGPETEVLITGGVPRCDYLPFRDIGPGAAQWLLGVLPHALLGDRQNNAPTLGALLRACACSEGRVRLSGYAVGPQRPDERVTVDGLWVADSDLLELEVNVDDALWGVVRERYGLGDAYQEPDEVRNLPRRDGGPVGTWLWWD